MGFAENKQQEFTKKIRDLPDQPNMQPHELKEYFDSSPEELRQSYNGLCDALTAKTAASALGFSRTAGVPADTVQTAVENVQQQLDAAVMGNIPSGSVTGDKLAQDVRDRLTAIESAAAAEAGTRQSTDSGLQSQINTLSAAKCELYTGTYVGNIAHPNSGTQQITLGFRPKAVLVMQYGFWTEYDHQFQYKNSLGGIAINSWSNTGIVINDTGFEVRQSYTRNPETGMDSTRVNTAGDTYVYLAFK